jgi:hypothetical protein
MNVYAIAKPGTARAARWAEAGIIRIRLYTPEAVRGLFVRQMSARCAISAEALFYRGDVSDLGPKVVDGLVRELAHRFHVAEAEVRQSMTDPAHGLPILADADIELVDEQ